MPRVDVTTVNVVWLAFFAGIISQLGEAKWVEGTVHTGANWDFITRFCFLTQKGTLSYEFRYPVAYGTQEILLYYDTPGQWDAVYKRGKNCDEKYSVLSPTSNQIIALNTSNTQTSSFSGCQLITYLGATWYNCTGKRSFSSTRERWWYVVFARCGEAKSQVTGLYMEYKIHMTNGDDILHQEYSADEFYILPVDVFFLVVYCIILVLSCICAVKLRKRQLFHTTYKIYMTSVVIWTLHLILKVAAWSYYGITGWEISSTEVTGRSFQEFSNIVFILMLILMAKGYTITRGALSKTSITKITAFMLVFSFFTVAVFIWEGMLFDPGKVLYYYESPPGYCMVSLRLIGWLWFVYATVFTLKHTDKKSLFYIPFFSFFTLWFWAGPMVILIAMFVMAKWSREKTVNGVEQFIGLLGHAFFLFLTRPSAANSNFPYHVRTSQIDTFGNDDVVLGDQNPYFISGRADFTGTGPNLEFFITSKKNESDNVDEGERMYRPLEAEFFNFPSCPPPSYPQAVSTDNAISVSVHSPPESSPVNRQTVSSNIATMINSNKSGPFGGYADTSLDGIPAIGFVNNQRQQIPSKDLSQLPPLPPISPPSNSNGGGTSLPPPQATQMFVSQRK